jgi:cyanobactin maturation PatA/PatG family protease
MGASANIRCTTRIPGLRHLWAESIGHPGVCIAILDGPVDLAHPSLAGAHIKLVETLVAGDGNAGAAAEHGTFVTSLIFGQRNSAVLGIAPACCGLILPIFSDAVDGAIAPCSQLDLARALLQALDAGAHVINVSGGELADSDAAHPLLAAVVRQCVARGVLIVAASGNDSCGRPQIPGSMPGVLSVGAMGRTGDAICAVWRDRYRRRAILAPGDEILGASPGGRITTASGSSFSTAIVSGVAAVLLSIQVKAGQSLNADVVRRAILQSAWDDSLCDQNAGRRTAGELNIKAALERVTEGVHNMAESIGVAENGTGQATEGGDLSYRTLPIPDLDGRADGVGNGSGESATATRAPAVEAPRADVGKHESTAAKAKSGSCSCSCSGPAQLVYALGQLGYDFGTEARRDSILQHMGPAGNPHDPRQLLAYLEDNPWDAASITWTLNLDSTPLYGIKPAGPFAREICERLREFLGQQLDEGVERVSIPGQIAGKSTLTNGQVVPLIIPELRGMYSWTTRALIEAVCGTTALKSGRNGQRAQKVLAVGNFLERVYYASRNLGLTAQDRALNYAATNALNVERVFEAAMREEMDLDTIELERSPVCRPDSDCWDVKLMFFFPKRQVQSVRRTYRFTVDVSDVVPVMVGKTRSWFVR